MEGEGSAALSTLASVSATALAEANAHELPYFRKPSGTSAARNYRKHSRSRSQSPDDSGGNERPKSPMKVDESSKKDIKEKNTQETTGSAKMEEDEPRKKQKEDDSRNDDRRIKFDKEKIDKEKSSAGRERNDRERHGRDRGRERDWDRDRERDRERERDRDRERHREGGRDRERDRDRERGSRRRDDYRDRDYARGKDDRNRDYKRKDREYERKEYQSGRNGREEEPRNAEDSDVAKPAPMNTVNQNSGGTGFMTADAKKKLLWAGKREQQAPPDAAGKGHWDSVQFADRERQEKFNKLMGLKTKQEDTSKVSGERGPPQDKMQADLEKQYAAGLRRRDGRTVGLGL